MWKQTDTRYLAFPIQNMDRKRKCIKLCHISSPIVTPIFQLVRIESFLIAEKHFSAKIVCNTLSLKNIFLEIYRNLPRRLGNLFNTYVSGYQKPEHKRTQHTKTEHIKLNTF